MKVIGFGDNIVDRFLDRKVMYPGGNCVNVAVLARRSGAQAGYLGVFGSDSLGGFVRSAIEAEGVEASRCIVRDGPNGVTEIRVVDGDREFLGWNDGGVTISQPFVLGPDDLDYLGTADLVHSSVYSASETQLPALRTAGTLVSFDYSSEAESRSERYLRRTAPYVDLALFSFGDQAASLAEWQLRGAVAAGASLAVGTRGAAGALLFDGNRFFVQGAVPIDPRRFTDTMGCGDAFLTGLVLALLDDGWTRSSVPSPAAVERALAAAAGLAAEQCYVEGAFGYGLPVDAQAAPSAATRI